MCQEGGFLLKGRVTDAATGLPLTNVNVYINETMTGTTSLLEGKFELKIPSTPAILVFSNVGYTRRYFTLMQPYKGEFEVPMERSTHEIQEVVITARRSPVPISDELDMYVVDYDFYDNHILLLGHPGNRSSETVLVMTDRMGKTLARNHVNKGINLYRDPFNNLHLLSSDSAFQLYYDDKELQLLYGIEKNRFMNLFPEFLKVFNNRVILRQYAFDDQVLMYYFYTPGDSTIQRFWSQASTQVHRKYSGSMNIIPITRDGKGSTEYNLFNSDERFIKMAYYAPIFCPLELIRDTIYIFNFNHGVIEILGRNGLPIAKSSLITFQTEPGWQKRLYVDPISNKVYTEYLVFGITTLREIDLTNGFLKDQKIRVPDYPYVMKIMFHDGFLYFLYQEKRYPKYQKLFRMQL